MERFSERAKRVLEVADAEAHLLDHPYVGTEHLLLGLVADAGPTGNALAKAGASVDATRDKVSEAVGHNSPRQRGDLEQSVRARRALDRASRLSLQRRDDQVDPEHILVGVLDVEGRAGQVLRGLGVDVAALRAAVDLPNQVVHIGGPKAAPDQEGHDRPHVSPQCAVCGMALEDALAYGVVEGRDGKDRRDFVVAYCSSCGAALGTMDS